MDELAAYFGFMIGVPATLFGIIALALSIKDFSEIGIWGVLGALCFFLIGGIILLGSLHTLDTYND